jgi:hypothetical protein
VSECVITSLCKGVYLHIFLEKRVCVCVSSGTHSFCAAVAPLTRPLHYKPIGRLSRPALRLDPAFEK